MSKVSFDPEANGRVFFDQNRDMGRSAAVRPFEPVVVMKPGIEAIYEGLRLANIQGFEEPRR